MDNHGGKHDLKLTESNYANSTITGCTNSGDGCHGPSYSTDIATYHPNSGCLSGPCHTSASRPSKKMPFTCMDCHNGTYIGAVDAVGLTDASPIGHYSNAVHTIGAMDTTMSVWGGTYSAPCSTCHNPTGAGSINGEYRQHQNLNGRIDETTCSDCHNYNAAIKTIVTDANRDNTCEACHTAGVLPGKETHSLTQPSAPGTESAGVGTCVNAPCHIHTTNDLHQLHKSNNSGNPNGCTMTGCHSTTAQGLKPTPSGCGAGGSCHTTDPHSALKHYNAYAGPKSAECKPCHDNTDIRVNHKQQCELCHNNPSFPNLLGEGAPTNSVECLDCHKSATHAGPVGSKNYLPLSDHGIGTEASHTVAGSQANETTTTLGNTYACDTCHDMDVNAEHDKGSASFPNVPATYSTKCVACHKVRVQSWADGWSPRSCAKCHTSKHTGYTAAHDSGGFGASCQTSLTAGTAEIESFDSTTAPAWPATGWTRTIVYGATNWVTSSLNVTSAPNAARFAPATAVVSAAYFQKTFDLRDYTNPQISFWYRRINMDATVDYSGVKYSIDGGTTWVNIMPRNYVASGTSRRDRRPRQRAFGRDHLAAVGGQRDHQVRGPGQRDERGRQLRQHHDHGSRRPGVPQRPKRRCHPRRLDRRGHDGRYDEMHDLPYGQHSDSDDQELRRRGVPRRCPQRRPHSDQQPRVRELS